MLQSFLAAELQYCLEEIRDIDVSLAKNTNR